jgi:hypothetical protein
MNYDSTEEEGITLVDRIVTRDLRWIFRDQRKADRGIDAQFELCSEGKARGRLVAAQIKAGPSRILSEAQLAGISRPLRLGRGAGVLAVCTPSTYQAHFARLEDTNTSSSSVGSSSRPRAYRSGGGTPISVT